MTILENVARKLASETSSVPQGNSPERSSRRSFLGRGARLIAGASVAAAGLGVGTRDVAAAPGDCDYCASGYYAGCGQKCKSVFACRLQGWVPMCITWKACYQEHYCNYSNILCSNVRSYWCNDPNVCCCTTCA